MEEQKTIEKPIIMVNNAGRVIMEQLCDIALKSGGIKNYNGVTQILTSLKALPETPSISEKKEGE